MTNDELSRIVSELEKILDHSKLQRISDFLTNIGLTQAETEAWKENEPDFAKRIATPLDARRPPPDKLPVYPTGGSPTSGYFRQLVHHTRELG